MEMPIVDKCFGIFPPKYGCYLIAIGGLALGGSGIAGVILFGVLEEIFCSYFLGTTELDPDVKKLVIGTIGITSLLLVAANLMLFFGTTLSKRGLVGGCKWTLFAMNLILITMMISLPLSCFFLQGTECLIKLISIIGTILVYSFLGAFLSIWLYFMVVVYNLQLEL